ncbi:class F sortase [Streptomyces aculeolatus]|uniref:class F sortase n=1 Tax=Streptomyces aculeolatus TaxID=270689 RepID=UPI001CED1E02|nr:class F sortase [Streptomyces aculeolatus]
MALRPHGGRRGAWTAAATAMAATGIALLAVAAFAPHPTQPPPPPAARTPHTPATPPAGEDLPVLGPARPVRITVEDIGLDAAVDAVGTADDGTIALPDQGDHAGWYTASPTPGQRGNALLVGHVDTTRGPAVFYALGALRKGDRIAVQRADGSTAQFTVTTTNVYPQKRFPTETVYAPTTQPRLTLITCTDWDNATRTYTANLVITAHPEPKPGKS